MAAIFTVTTMPNFECMFEVHGAYFHLLQDGCKPRVKPFRFTDLLGGLDNQRSYHVPYTMYHVFYTIYDILDTILGSSFRYMWSPTPQQVCTAGVAPKKSFFKATQAPKPRSTRGKPETEASYSGMWTFPDLRATNEAMLLRANSGWNYRLQYVLYTYIHIYIHT